MEGALLGFSGERFSHRFEEDFVKVLIVLETPTLSVDRRTVLCQRLLAESDPNPVTVAQLINDIESSVNRDDSDLF